jgi:hypothetical protein
MKQQVCGTLVLLFVYFQLNNVYGGSRFVIDGKRWATVQELEADLLDEEYELDIMFVLMLRRLTSQFIIENKHMKLANNGTTSLEDIILDAFPDYE